MKKIIWDHPDGQSREAARDVDAWEVRTAAHGDLGKVSGQKYRYRGQETAVRRNQGESFAHLERVVSKRTSTVCLPSRTVGQDGTHPRPNQRVPYKRN